MNSRDSKNVKRVKKVKQKSLKEDVDSQLIESTQEKDTSKETLESSATPAIVSSSEGTAPFIRLSMDVLETWQLNPNDEDADTFNQLVEEIKEDNENPEDMDQPLIVVPKKGEEGKFIVYSGNHRLKALKMLGAETVICKIKDWDEKTAFEKAFKRNNLVGKWNDAKMTRAVNHYARENKMDIDKIPHRLGFVKDAEFFKHYKSEKKKALDKAGDKAKEKAKDELNKVENLTFILNKLFHEYGETLENEFMFFTYGAKLHLMVQMDEAVQHFMEKITDAAIENGLDVNQILSPILEDGVDTLDGVLLKAKEVKHSYTQGVENDQEKGT